MYIRRKVFSVAIDQATGEEKLFSVNEVISEESYQKMFAKAEEEEKPKKSHKGAKIAAGATGAAALTAGGTIYGADKLANRLEKARRAEHIQKLRNISKEFDSKRNAVNEKWADVLTENGGIKSRKGIRADELSKVAAAEKAAKGKVAMREAGKVEKLARKVGTNVIDAAKKKLKRGGK